jgi:hypothetical protein
MGRNSVLIGEFKTCGGNLTYLTHFNKGAPSEELKDFMKARYYYLANRIPRCYLEGAAIDYGQVSTNTNAGVSIGKGPTTGQEEYRLFKEKGVRLRRP